MENKQTRIIKHFLYKIYKDISLAICALVLFIGVPLGLAIIFSPDLIAKQGYGAGWATWTVGILLIMVLAFIIYAGIYSWFDWRWEKAKKEVEGKNGR